MAVDEWLLETTEVPVLRIYRWLGKWASVGYFGALGQAMTAFPGVCWVRRWTGGGAVDHRGDWTYTMVVPTGESLLELRGAESYRRVHAALAQALVAEGLEVRLSTGTETTGAALCFENPVSHDLIGPGGRKLAGAGQRRTRHGLLHQGSVAADAIPMDSHQRAGMLAGCLSLEWSALEIQPPMDVIARKIADRYGRKEWTGRR